MRGKTTGDRHGTCIEGSKHRVCLGEDAVERQHHLIAERVELHESTAERKRGEDVGLRIFALPGKIIVRALERETLEPAAVSAYTTFISES